MCTHAFVQSPDSFVRCMLVQMWQNVKIANFMCQLYIYKSSFLYSCQIVRFLCQTIYLHQVFYFIFIFISTSQIFLLKHLSLTNASMSISSRLFHINLENKIHVKFYKSRKPGAEHFKKEEGVWKPAVQKNNMAADHGGHESLQEFFVNWSCMSVFTMHRRAD